MTRASALIFVCVAAVLVGCGDNGQDASSLPPKTATGQVATLGVAKTSLGSILVDSTGRTLYLFEKDDGPASRCADACASAWPPLRATGKVTVGTGADAAAIGTTQRPDGVAQVTYNGHPLYLFRGDHEPGEANGQQSTAFGAEWYALSPAGSPVTTPSEDEDSNDGY
jgi:predicted lipoprotein with Yx(FWY)xxD motif